MYIVSYDFESDRRRTRFCNFLKKYGRRLQYSVFEIKNSRRVLENIITEVELKYVPDFTNNDSIVIVPICKGCIKTIRRYGYTAQEEEEVVIF